MMRQAINNIEQKSLECTYLSILDTKECVPLLWTVVWNQDLD